MTARSDVRARSAARSDIGNNQERLVDLIDCDIHLRPRSDDELISFMPAYWKDKLGDRRRLEARQAHLPFGSGDRLDAEGGDGPAGSDADLVRRQLFVDEKIDFGMITPTLGHGPDSALNAALFGAINAWQAATWLSEPEQRLFGSICVPIDDVAAATREIEKWGGHRGFRQVLVAQDADRPFGHPMYEPIWSTAARLGLPVAIHFQDSGRLALGLTPVGHFLRYVDFHSLARPLEYAAHLVGFICSGVFSRIPDLRVVFLEGGFLWHHPVLERLAYQWDRKKSGLYDPVPDPRQCVAEHIRFASQPLEAAPSQRALAQAMLAAGAERTLMFSSDYPHYDYDAPDRVVPHGLEDGVRRRIMFENARELYGLPDRRALGPYDQTAA